MPPLCNKIIVYRIQAIMMKMSPPPTPLKFYSHNKVEMNRKKKKKKKKKKNLNFKQYPVTETASISELQLQFEVLKPKNDEALQENTSQNFQNWNLLKNPEAETIKKGILNRWGLKIEGN